MTKVAKVVVNPEFCKSCLFCVETCSEDVLQTTEATNSMGYQYVVPVSPENCTGCMKCAIICPDAAIEIYLEEE